MSHNIMDVNEFLSSDELLIQLSQQLWKEDSQGNTPIVYGIFDGARNKSIEKIIRLGTLKSYCLYEGKLSYQMSVAAPYIVKLERDHPQTNELLSKGWGNSWGVFAVTHPPATLINVRHNCRKIARVKSPEGKNLVFRYYDPRVLRIYLPTCNLEEAQKVFGPISEFIVEGEKPNTLHRFKIKDSGVEDTHNNAPISEGLLTPTLNIAGIKKITPVKVGPLQITTKQYQAFEAVKFKQFVTDMEQHLIEHFKSKTTKLIQEKQLNDWVKRNIRQAQQFGFTTELDICRYLNVAIVQGESIKDAPWLQKIMAEKLFSSTKATLIEEKSLELLNQEHEEAVKALDDINQQLLERFYLKHHKKVLGLGAPLYGLSFTDDAALKEWMFDTGKQCIDLGLTDEMALDLWLDIAMRYGKDFAHQSWALLSDSQKHILSPEENLFYLLAQQPHKVTQSSLKGNGDIL
ncbi:DUF4123 domain-containing protein [Psychromonas sp.]|nr:DUF4123 domain-containing protein [Psychromonas sp.]